MEKQSEHKYDDMLDLPHHESSVRPKMPLMKRAAQFAPFDALSGFGDAIREAARQTVIKRELDPNEQEELERRLAFLTAGIREHPTVEIAYFQSDSRKDGGEYVSASGTLEKIDRYARLVVLSGNRMIPVDDIVSITGEVFSCSEYWE